MVYDDYADIGIFAKWVMDVPEIGERAHPSVGRRCPCTRKGIKLVLLIIIAIYRPFSCGLSKFANVCEFHFRNLSKRPFILPRIPCGFIGVSKPVSSVCFICRPAGSLFL